MDALEDANLTIVGICGSLRRDSQNRAALELAGSLMPASMTLQIESLMDLPMYNYDTEMEGLPPALLRLRERIDAADGVLIATPEHNRSMPASLKNAIDWSSRFKPGPFLNKPCAVFSVTPGVIGGASVQYDVRRSLGVLGALFLHQPEVFITSSDEKFDAAGTLHDTVSREFLALQMAAFQQWILRLKRAFG